MRSTLSLLLASVFLIPSLSAQNVEWENNFGTSSADNANSIIGSSDGGFAVAGEAPGGKFWVVKLDGNGNLQWDQEYGGNSSEEAHSIVQTSDGGFAVAGESLSSSGDVGGNQGEDDVWVLKLDGSGNIEWENNFGGDTVDRARAIVQTSDGGYAVAGYSHSSNGDVGGNKGKFDYWVLKLDGNGNLEWENNFGGSEHDNAHAIAQTSDGGFFVAGGSKSSDGDVGGNNGGIDHWVIKLDGNGNLQWEANFGGSGNDFTESFTKTSDGGFAVAGFSTDADGDVGGNEGLKDYWILKLDGNGNLQWETNYGGLEDEVANSIIETSDGGLAVAGHSTSSSGDVGGNYGWEDHWLLKLDGNGNLEWEGNFGGSSQDKARSLVQDSDGAFVMVGTSRSSDNDVGGNKGYEDGWVVKVNGPSSSLAQNENAEAFYVRPNPSSGKIRIEFDEKPESAQVRIRDLTGRTIESQKVEETRSFRTRIEGEPGIYFVELSMSDGRKEVRKVVKE